MLQTDLLQWLSRHLESLGPGLLFVVCMLETAVFAGLVLPVGGLIAFAALLSSRGIFDPAEVILFSFFGALVGDQIGFAMGRWFAPGARPPKGNIAGIWRLALKRTEALVRRQGSFSLSLGRTIPFVRTMMPWFAGRSGIGWLRFTTFDLLGVVLWGAVYIGGGFVVGIGWRQAAGNFGEAAGAAVIGIVILSLLLLTRTWLRLRRNH